MYWTIIGIIILFFFGILGNKKPVIALTLMPFVCICLAVSIVIKEQPIDEFTVIFFGIIPVIVFATLLAVISSRKGDEPDKWFHKLAKWFLTSLIILIILSTGTFLGFGFAILPLGILITALIYNFFLTSHRSTAAYVITTIGSCMRQNLPLPMALETASQGRKDNKGRILRTIKKWLVEGYPLSEAVKRGYPRCPGYATAMIESAERINQLPQAFGAIRADMVAESDESKRVQPIHPFYPVLLIIFVLSLVWLHMTFVIPQFKMILYEMFETSLPVSTRFLMDLAEVIRTIQPVIVVLMLFFVFVVLPYALYVRFRPRRAEKPYLTSRAGDFIKWHLPILHWFSKNRSLLSVTEFLRVSLNSGATVNGAIRDTTRLDVNNCFRKRLKRWLAEVEAGEGISQSARENGLGEAIAWAFDQKVNPNNTLTILKMLEKFYRSNYNYYVNLTRFILWPCVVIIIGLLVGFVVYGMYSPYILIISELAKQVMP